jgi:hypothetical protein
METLSSLLAPISFTLTDADGGAHRYEVTPHNALEGQRITYTLLRLGAEPLGRLVQTGLQNAGLLDGGLRSLLDDPAALGRLAAGIDFAAVGADLQKSMGSMPMEALTLDLMAHAVRDGKQLRSPLHFNAAFTRNYMEMLRACWEVVKANRFLSL